MGGVGEQGGAPRGALYVAKSRCGGSLAIYPCFLHSLSLLTGSRTLRRENCVGYSRLVVGDTKPRPYNRWLSQ
ncbi:hypothetical protein PMIN04_006850 [Paraphaeosphaeria minitans]